MSPVRQQKWVHCVQIDEVRLAEARQMEKIFRALFAPYSSAITHITVDHYHEWQFKFCVEGWYGPADIAHLSAKLPALARKSYRGTVKNIRSWDSAAMAPGLKAQFRTV